MRRFRPALLAALVFFSVTVGEGRAASVVDDDGNFYYSEITDIAAPGGSGMAIRRVYNSTSDYPQGSLGYNWSYRYAVRFEPRADGAVVFHEYGAGADNVFLPADERLHKTARQIIDQILAAQDARRSFGSVAERDRYENYLATGGDDVRNAAWKSLVRSGALTVEQVPIGTAFVSTTFGAKQLVRVREGYERRSDSETETFDERGRLISLRDSAHHFTTLRYDSAGNLAQMSDGLGTTFTFTLNDQREIDSIADNHGHVVRYGYRGRDLVRVTTADGTSIAYAYDTSHGVVAIVRTGDFPIDVGVRYNGDHQVLRLIGGDGTVTDYERKPAGFVDHYLVIITRHVDGRDFRSTIEVDDAPATDKSYYRRRIVSADGRKTETTYDEKDAVVKTTTTNDPSTFSLPPPKLLDTLAHAEKPALGRLPGARSR